MSVEEIIIQLKEIQKSNGRIFDQQFFASNEAIDNAIKLLSRPKGKWEASTNGTDYRVCSNCLYERHAGTKYNYCPICGTDMRGEEHKNGETFTREELTKWLLTFVHKNSVLGKQCERLIKKLDDFETFIADMRGKE